ncbi:MAG: HD domain-containing protein [Treponema sp.]|nr:HD domain-containing protein [Treponema sp.]
MSKELLTIINITLDYYNIVIGIILFISVLFRKTITDKVRTWFKHMVLCNIIMAASDIFTWIFEGTAHPGNRYVLPAAMFIFYFMSFAVVITSGYYILNFLNKDKGKKFLKGILILLAIVYLVILVATPFTDLLYKIDQNNIYSRGQYFVIPIILEIILYCTLVIYIILNLKAISKDQLFTVIWFLIFPQATQIIQLIFYGVSTINTGFTLAFLVAFILSNRRLEETLDFKESELDEKESELSEKEFELHEKVSEIERSKLQVIKMQNHTIESLSNLVENRDEDTGEHVRRTRAYVELLAVQLMKNGHYPEILTPRYIRFLKRAAPMHDIGKIVVPDAVLKKPGRLTPDEFAQMKRHAAEGGRIVHEILDGYEDPEYIRITADIATHHHEKWDGSGYPDGLKGEAIPLCARIMAIADVFDALVSPRIYKSPMTYEEAYKIIETGIGVHFDPIIAKEFLNIKEKTAAVNESFKGI